MSIGFKMLLFFAVASFAAWPLLFAGIGTRRDTRRRNETEHTRATGVIVDYVQTSTRSGRNGRVTWYKPVVEFSADGQKFRLEYPNMMDRNQYPVGTDVDLRYDVSDPTHFHLESDPVFTHPGTGAIRVALIWILASAALTVALAVFVGGLRL